jgi:hypothetical protein
LHKLTTINSVVMNGLAPVEESKKENEKIVATFEITFGQMQIQYDEWKNKLYFYGDSMTLANKYNITSSKVAAWAAFQSTGTSDARGDSVRPCLYSPASIRLLPMEAEKFGWNLDNIESVNVTLEVEFGGVARHSKTSM